MFRRLFLFSSLFLVVLMPVFAMRTACLNSSLADLWSLAGGSVDITVQEAVDRGFADDEAIIVDSASGRNINTEILVSAEPDLVIAGINHGYNLSADIVYSGTCDAARQASFYGMKAIALSAEDGCGRDTFEKAARFVLDNLDALSASIKPMTFLNINVPIAFNGEWEKAGIGFVRYLDDISVVEERGNVRELEINGCEFHRFPSLDAYRADYEICASGKAAITLVDVLPHTADMGGFIL